MTETLKIVDHRGIRGVCAAKLLTDTAEEITYGEVRRLCGTSSLTKTTETSIGQKYYDNVPAIIIRSSAGDEVALDTSAISEANLAWLNGEYYDEADDLYIEGESNMDYFALGYITKKTDGTERFVWRLKGSFTNPEAEHNTEDDGTDSTGNSMTYSGIFTQHKFEKDGKAAKAVNVGAALYDEEKFFATVQTPDTYAEAKKTT